MLFQLKCSDTSPCDLQGFSYIEFQQKKVIKSPSISPQKRNTHNLWRYNYLVMIRKCSFGKPFNTGAHMKSRWFIFGVLSICLNSNTVELSKTAASTEPAGHFVCQTGSKCHNVSLIFRLTFSDRWLSKVPGPAKIWQTGWNLRLLVRMSNTWNRVFDSSAYIMEIVFRLILFGSAAFMLPMWEINRKQSDTSGISFNGTTIMVQSLYNLHT